MAASKVVDRKTQAHDSKELPPFLGGESRDTTEPVRSSPVDLYQVSTRLLQLCNERERSRALSESSASPGNSPPCWSGSSSPLTPEEQHLQNIGYERRFYGKLVKHGAQPWYPIDQITEVSKNPGEHRELLQYWQRELETEDEDCWMVFGQQWERWKKFRNWQLRMRKKFEGHMSFYINRAHELLERQGFTSPFEFDEDPKKQDKITTWIEYMSYEYIRHERVSWYKSREGWYDETWQKLVDSNVLKEDETRELIHSSAFTNLRQDQKVQRRQAVEEGRSAVLLAHRDLLDPSIPAAVAQESLAIAQNQLDTSIQIFETFKYRNDLIEEFLRDTIKYKKAKDVSERHLLLLLWMREQFPLIERETRENKLEEESGSSHEGQVATHEKASRTAEGENRGTAKQEDENESTLRGHSAKYKQAQDRKHGYDEISSHDHVPTKRARHRIEAEEGRKISLPEQETEGTTASTPDWSGMSSPVSCDSDIDEASAMNHGFQPPLGNLAPPAVAARKTYFFGERKQWRRA